MVFGVNLRVHVFNTALADGVPDGGSDASEEGVAIRRILDCDKMFMNRKLGTENITTEKFCAALAVLDIPYTGVARVMGGKRDEIATMRGNIKKKYRGLSRMLHPDKCHIPGASDAFSFVEAAKRIATEKLDALEGKFPASNLNRL